MLVKIAAIGSICLCQMLALKGRYWQKTPFLGVSERGRKRYGFHLEILDILADVSAAEAAQSIAEFRNPGSTIAADFEWDRLQVKQRTKFKSLRKAI